MIVESFLKGSLLPALLLSFGCLLFGRWFKNTGGVHQDLAQGFLFLAAYLWALFFIRGGVGQWRLGGMESSLLVPMGIWITALFSKRLDLGFIPKALGAFGVMTLLIFPMWKGLTEVSSFSSTEVRVAFAFGLLAWSLWSYGERKYFEEEWVQPTAAGIVAWSVAAVLFLFKGSAMLSQIFGFFATVQAVMLAVSVFPGWVISFRMSAGFLLAVPILFLGAGAIYVNIHPLVVMGLCLPFLASAFTPQIFSTRKGIISCSIKTVLISLLSLSWLLFLD